MARITLFRRRPPPAPPEGEAVAEQAPETAPADGAAPPQEAAAEAPPARAPRRPPYHPGALRRERKALARAREERIRDLGGLILEMFRRDRFREDLIRGQTEEVFGMESRIGEIDGVLIATRRQVQTARCACGAPIVWGSHFCANCGRPTGEAVVTCSNCGHPLPGDAHFCGNCGTAAPPQTEQSAPSPPAPSPEGASAPAPAEETGSAPASAEGPRDPWEQ
jgi:hypothetical protein